MQPDRSDKVIIVGAGIAGLSLAYHLGLPYHLYEKEHEVGGLCRSIELAGCVFDYAPKILLLGNRYATDLSCQLLGDNVHFTAFSDWSYHHHYGVFTRTPIQKHLYGLPIGVVLRVLIGMARARFLPGKQEVRTYQDWLYRNLGRPIADMVIIPQERKKWKHDPAIMDYRWAPARVSRPSLRNALLGAIRDIPHTRRFGYTREGGIGALMNAFAAHVNEPHLGVGLRSVDITRRTVSFTDGSTQRYSALVSTIPLPILIDAIPSAPLDIQRGAQHLSHLSLQCVCIVVEANRLSDRHFVYVHDPQFIFHRVSFLSNLSPNMAPPGYATLQAEVSYLGRPPLDDEALITRVHTDLRIGGFLRPSDHIVASQVLTIPYAYPLQSPDRLDNMRKIQAYLEQHDIYTFGRFGEWEYYNMHDIIPRARDLAGRLEQRYGQTDRQVPSTRYHERDGAKARSTHNIPIVE